MGQEVLSEQEHLQLLKALLLLIIQQYEMSFALHSALAGHNVVQASANPAGHAG